MIVCVHPIQAAIWRNRHKITPERSLREIGKIIRVDSPQLIKHHLNQMVKLGSINYIEGNYVFPEAAREDIETAMLYNELLNAVGNKYLGESRHETALRYITSAELSKIKEAQSDD